MRSWELASVPVLLSELPDDRIEHDRPAAGTTDVLAWRGLDLGVWELSEGVSTDVEVDEVSIVLSGRATLEIDGSEPIALEPGVLLRLNDGERTRWTVHERLRKLYLLPTQPDAEDER